MNLPRMRRAPHNGLLDALFFVTLTDDREVFQSNEKILVPASTVQVSTNHYADDAEEIQEIQNLIHEKMDEGGCAGIIVNSVKCESLLYV